MRNPCFELPLVLDQSQRPESRDSWIPDGDQSSVAASINDDASSVGQILSEEQRRLLSAELPRAVRGYGGQRWRCLYSLKSHGASLETLLSRAAEVRDTLIVVNDMQGAIFGCFCAEPWKRSRGYSGSGDCWVFTFEPRERANKMRERLMRAEELRSAIKEEEQRRENEAEIAEAARRDAMSSAFTVVDPISSSNSSIKGSISSNISQRKESASIDDAPPPPLSPSLHRVPLSSTVKVISSSSSSSSSPTTTASSSLNSSSPTTLYVYRSANQNKLFQYVSLVPSAIQTRVATGLGLGGGSNFALHLDGSLDRGCSGPCQTFLSPRLSSSEDELDGDGDTPAAALLLGGGGADKSQKSIEADLALSVGDLGKDGAFRALNVELFVFD